MPSSRLMRPCTKRFSRFGILAVTHARIMSGMLCHREFHRVGRRAEKSTSKDTGFFRRLTKHARHQYLFMHEYIYIFMSHVSCRMSSRLYATPTMGVETIRTRKRCASRSPEPCTTVAKENGVQIIEPRVQTVKAEQDIWTGGPASLGAVWKTETRKYSELHAFFASDT